jgi:hypothetical protein
MSRAAWVGATLGVALTLLGCKKEPPPAEPPRGPTVIVEVPGPAAPPPDRLAEAEERPTEFGTFETVVSDVPCKSDVDCAKAECCHATSCVALADAPDCSAAVCTLECRARTMDCNGGCLCQAGRCAAQLWSAPG